MTRCVSRLFLLSLHLRVAIVCGFLFLASGCGGGTSGTGVRTFDGDVRLETGEPLEGVMVTIPSTGDSSTTDSSGHFYMVSKVRGDRVELMLEKASFRGTVVVAANEASGTHVSVQLTVDSATNQITATDFALRVSIDGNCQQYFDVGDVIKQSAYVPDNTVCTLKVMLEGNGDLRGYAPIAIQFASCDDDTVWQTITTALTEGPGDNLGVALIPFEYIDSPQYCRYRVVGPYEDGEDNPALFPIETLTEQFGF